MAIKPNVLNGLTKEQESAVLQEAARIYNSQEEKDKRVIKQYESTPDYNILERTFNSTKRDDYKAKQNIANEYNAAKGRQTETFIADNGITYDLLDSVFGVEGGNPIGMGTSARMKQTTESKNNENYLKSLGADMDYLEKYYKSELNNKALQNVADATKNAPVAMNTLSTVGNTLTNTSYGLGAGLEWLTGNTNLADELDFGVQANQAIRQTTKEDVIGEDKKVGNLLYDVGMGAADFGGSLALGGGNPLLARLFQTSSAVGGSAYDAKERGLTDSQAMAEGLLGGAAEYALGKLPLDTLFKTNADDAILKTILKQAGSEAIEEGGTSAFNAIVDSIIAGENSNFNLKKKEYMASGMSEEEATKQAFFDTLKEIGYEGAVGGLSGGVIGGVNTAVQRVGNRSNNSIVNELEPLANAEVAPKVKNVTEQAQTITEPIAKTTESGNTATLNTQPTNTMANPQSALNSQIQGGIEKSNIDTLTETIYNDSVNSDGLLNRSGLNGENINSGTGIAGISGKRTESGHQYSGEVAKTRENSGRNTGLSQELVVTSEGNKAKLNEKGITSNEFRSTKNNPELFSFALDTARSANKKGAMVSKRSASELAEGNLKTFLSPDGLVGGAVEENGNITAVFKNPKSKSKGAVADIIITALQNGGTKLDCYGEFLLDSYSRLGFEPVAKVKFVREFADPDWNYDELGEPDIYFMKHNGKSIDEVVDDYVNGNAVVYSQEYIDSLPYMEYEEAEAYRDSLIPNKDASFENGANNIVPDLANLDTFNQYASNGKTRISQTATHTFTNSTMFKKSTLSKQNLEDVMLDGKADVDIVSENESLQRASDMLDKDYNGTIRKLQSDKQYSGAETDAAMMVLEEKLNNAEMTGDYVDAMKWARMVVDKAHKIGQGLQAFAKYSRTAPGTIVKTQKLANEVTEKYFKKNQNLKNSMGKLGTALSQIGNETVNEVNKTAKSIEQIRKEVATALLNEPVSIAKQFGSADVEYLSRAIEKGMTAKDLSKMLEQKLATGSFGISDSDINEIIQLFDEADKYGETSKQSYDLQQ